MAGIFVAPGFGKLTDAPQTAAGIAALGLSGAVLAGQHALREDWDNLRGP